MDDAFKTLKTQGKNNLDGIIQWMKDAKIIDGKVATEDKVRKLFSNASGPIEMKQFKEALDNLAKESKTNVDMFVSKLCDTGAVVDDAFEKMKREGKDNVDGLIKWMKESKVIGTAKESEEKARKMLEDVKDKQHVELEKFKDTVHKMAEDTESKFKNIKNVLQEHGPRLMSAFQAATSAFKDAVNK